MIRYKKINCRVCNSRNIEIFKIKHFAFHTKNEDWKSFFCKNCGAISEYNTSMKKTDYRKGGYRKYDAFQKNLNKEFKDVFPPLSSWSSVTFARWRHIWKLLKKNTSLFNNKIKMLDYGGYNGFLPYALKQKNKIISWVADLDEKGLGFAKLLGSKIINLNIKKIKKKDFFNLITYVHVLEHMTQPSKQLDEARELLKDNGIIYIEVPNLYCFPLGDNAHLISFTHYSLYTILKKSGFEVLNYGFVQTPKESFAFDYFYNNKKENLYMIAIKTKNKINKKKIPEKLIPYNSLILKKKLQISYARIMLNEISLNLLKYSGRYFRTFINFFLYGLVEIISLKIFKNSLINKYKK